MADYVRRVTNNDAMRILAGELGTRPSDMARLRWSDIDMERKTIRFRTAKNGIEAAMPMTPALVLYFSKKRPEGTLVFAKQAPRTHKEYHALRQEFLRKCCEL